MQKRCIGTRIGIVTVSHPIMELFHGLLLAAKKGSTCESVSAWPGDGSMNSSAMNRIAALAIMTLLISFTLECTPEEKATLYGGAPSGLIIRSEPTTTGEKLGSIKLGDPVEVLEQKDPSITIQGKTGKWTRVLHNSVEGWVFGGFLLANPPQKEEKKDEKKDKELPTVTSLEAGDSGCYVELTYPGGKVEAWYAYFDICDSPILNKKVTFTHEKGNVLADSCMGDPECPDMKEVDLINKVTVVE